MEKLIPSYRLVVTVSCLRAIRHMQKFGHLPPDYNLFKSYAVAGNFVDVRLAALEALVDFMQGLCCFGSDVSQSTQRGNSSWDTCMLQNCVWGRDVPAVFSDSRAWSNHDCMCAG